MVHEIADAHFPSGDIIVQGHDVPEQYVCAHIGRCLQAVQNRQLIPDAEVQLIRRLLYLFPRILPGQRRADGKKSLRLSLPVMHCHHRPHSPYGIADD